MDLRPRDRLMLSNSFFDTDALVHSCALRTRLLCAGQGGR